MFEFKTAVAYETSCLRHVALYWLCNASFALLWLLFLLPELRRCEESAARYYRTRPADLGGALSSVASEVCARDCFCTTWHNMVALHNIGFIECAWFAEMTPDKTIYIHCQGTEIDGGFGGLVCGQEQASADCWVWTDWDLRHAVGELHTRARHWT
eukprot:COSAG06_NODE_3068_length_5896_cov_126.296360_6_plen_156_part_00